MNMRHLKWGKPTNVKELSRVVGLEHEYEFYSYSYKNKLARLYVEHVAVIPFSGYMRGLSCN